MRILFVDDDDEYIGGILSDMQKEYVVDVAHNAEDGSYLFEVNDYDVVIVDEVLPDGSGRALCAKARDSGSKSPVVVLSEKFNYKSVIENLNCGADLSLPKSAKSGDLCTSVKALINKRQGTGKNILQYGSLTLDINNKEVCIKDVPVALRRREYDILEYLMINKGRVVSKEQLLEHIWVSGIYILSNTVEVHIRNIRGKIEKPKSLKIINTVRGYGYRIG